jgi:hypothetical protein
MFTFLGFVNIPLRCQLEHARALLLTLKNAKKKTLFQFNPIPRTDTRNLPAAPMFP